MNFTKAERISLKLHPELNENWVQGLIAADPKILGLGTLVLRDKERVQPRAGRLDLLLQHSETKRRYEVEVQLGSTDEAHIVRSIEYWDIERKRYPQYEHCAVVVAEDITSRFLNVVSLFNGVIPLIALQMQALKVGEHTTLVFTKVMDEMSRGVVDEDEDAEAAPTDRAYWEKQGTKATVQLADQLLAIVQEIDPSIDRWTGSVPSGRSTGDGWQRLEWPHRWRERSGGKDRQELEPGHSAMGRLGCPKGSRE
ncbi:hypothetical protein [Bradyrhizobium sp. USDA 3315]